MRKRLFEIIEVANGRDIASTVYDFFIMLVIFFSLVPIAAKSTTGYFGVLDKFVAIIFVFDYLFRVITADFKLGKSRKSFVIYPLTPMAIIDLLAILPSFIHLSGIFRVLKVLRLFRTLRVLRVFKIMRYSKSVAIILEVLRKQKSALIAVCALAFGYIIISALVMISVEPETFPTFFDAIYWATVSLTTVGYGDIYATSLIGKIITMLSSVCGIAIVALPAGIVTAGYMDELSKHSSNREQ